MSHIAFTHPFLNIKTSLSLQHQNITIALLDNGANGWATSGEWMNKWVSSKEQEGIIGTYFMPHHWIFLKYFHVIWLRFLWHGKNISWWSLEYFTIWTKVWCEDTNYSSNGCIQMVLLICNINVKRFWQMETLDWVQDSTQIIWSQMQQKGSQCHQILL
jgi:hypothetical protein